MLLSEEEIVETALLRYAQQAATKWGAARFAAEFERRDREERWLKAAQTGTFRYPSMTDGEGAPGPTVRSALVDAAVEEHVVGSDPGGLVLRRPKYKRHSSVPRPPSPELEPESRRARRRRLKRVTDDPTWMITPAEAARMSPAARRLYGLEAPDQVTRR